MTFRPSLGAVAAFLALGLSHPFHAQQPAVFRSGVDLISVDVTVLDRLGKPIEGLTADHFTVKVDGRERRVLWADFVRHGQRPLDPGDPADSALSYSSNEHFDPGRIVMIAVDQLHIRRVEGLAALRAAANFVDSLDVRDQVAAAPLDHGGTLDFTTDHTAVKRRLQGLTGAASAIPAHFNLGLSEVLAIADGSRTQLNMVAQRECGETLSQSESLARLATNNGVRDPCPVQVEQEARGFAQQARTEARLSLGALQRLIARLGDIEGPKTLVLVSEGLVAEPQLFSMAELGATAQAARVTLYVLQLDVPLFEAADSKVSPTMHADRNVRADGLSRIAGAARGALFTLVGSDPYPFKRIVREMSGYYLVAFEATDNDRDGRAHRIAVDASAPGATVRARPVFNIPTKLTPAATGSQLERLLRSPRLSTELPLRASAYSFQQAGSDQLKVLVSAETDQAGLGRQVTIGFVVVNDAGVIVASGGGATETGRYSLAAAVPPGRYLLRAAVVDAGGRQGSVERRFLARLGDAGGVKLSDLMVAEPTLSESEPLRPAVARAGGDSVVVYFEAYSAQDWKPEAPVSFQLLAASAGQPLATAPATFRSAGPGRWTASAALPLSNVPPGAYLATVEIALPGAAPQRLTRSFVVSR